VEEVAVDAQLGTDEGEQTKGNKNKKMPKYNPRKPQEHKEFSTPFTNRNCGQQKYRGWNLEGKAFYTKLHKVIAESQKAKQLGTSRWTRHVLHASRLHTAHYTLLRMKDKARERRERPPLVMMTRMRMSMTATMVVKALIGTWNEKLHRKT
jgi:hypothetical protein